MNTFGLALQVMALGMAGIFGVLLLIFGMIKLLFKLFPADK
jgi:hypothetical protein